MIIALNVKVSFQCPETRKTIERGALRVDAQDRSNHNGELVAIAEVPCPCGKRHEIDLNGKY
jgi:hypothetical protein